MTTGTATETDWEIIGTHVIPRNDLRRHQLADCWCRPLDDDGVIVHNSMDRRELYERGERQKS